MLLPRTIFNELTNNLYGRNTLLIDSLTSQMTEFEFNLQTHPSTKTTNCWQNNCWFWTTPEINLVWEIYWGFFQRTYWNFFLIENKWAYQLPILAYIYSRHFYCSNFNLINKCWLFLFHSHKKCDVQMLEQTFWRHKKMLQKKKFRHFFHSKMNLIRRILYACRE